MYLMNKYKDGKIYKLTSEQTDKIYIGSTIKSLEERLWAHKTAYNASNSGSHKTRKMSSFELLQYDDVKIELLENWPCDSKKELEVCESCYIRHNKDRCINQNIPTRTSAEYEKE